jgi:hypothetical protein
MAAGTTIQLKRKAGAFTGGNLAAGEAGVDTTNGNLSFSTTGSDVKTIKGALEGVLGVTIDGAGSAITAGAAGFLRVPYDCTITAADVVADQIGSIVVDVWKDTYANFPPTDADSITASAPPTLSSAQKSTDATLTGWTTALTEGEYLGFYVDSAATVTRATITLVVTRTS